MKEKKEILKILLTVLVTIFLMLCAATLFLGAYRKSREKEQKKQETMELLEKIPEVTPSPLPFVSPTPTPSPSPTPTPAVTKVPAFVPGEYQGLWYSEDGLAAVEIYALSQNKVSFFLSQSNKKGTQVSEADVSAEVAGNAAQFSFVDSLGNQSYGNMIFDRNGLYVKIETSEQAEGASVAPSVHEILTREKREPVYEPDPTAVPEPDSKPAQKGDYYFSESNSRYLTDEELSGYSSSELELAKNEIYARHGRKFVTKRIADYFNSKSWYQGTIDPEEFDSMQDSVFNEYEIANIEKIVEWEEKKRENGN